MNVRLSNGPGTVTWAWDPAPFGDSAGTLGLNDDADNNGTHVTLHVRFPGQLFDSETGLHYNYFRDCYNPSTGRYCQSDPIGIDGGNNTYLYAGGNPLSVTDPLGLQAIPFPATPPIAGPSSGSSRNIARALNNLFNKVRDFCTPQ